MSETNPLPNEAEARTPTGEIKEPQAQTEAKPGTPTEPTSPSEPTKSEPAEDKTLLNQREKDDVPDKYDFQAPADWAEKGFELDPATIEKATPLFKELGLSQAQAQKLIDFYAQTSMANNDAAIESMMNMRRDWESQVTKDSEMGPKLRDIKSTVSRAIDTVLGPEGGGKFRAAMDLTGAGSHPDFIRGIWKLAQKFVEGGHVRGNSPPAYNARTGETAVGQTRPASAASALYPNLP